MFICTLKAYPGCPELCGPQALADSRAKIRVSGSPKSLTFSLNAKPAVRLEADVEIVD